MCEISIYDVPEAVRKATEEMHRAAYDYAASGDRWEAECFAAAVADVVITNDGNIDGDFSSAFAEFCTTGTVTDRGLYHRGF